MARLLTGASHRSSAVLEDVESLEKTTIDQCKPIEMGLLARVEEITGSLSSDYVCQSSSVHFDFVGSGPSDLS